MAIQYDPAPGTVLLCDYDTGFRRPEMVKRRPALVISPRLHARHGLCTVVPLSTTPPRRGVQYQLRITLPEAPPPPFSQREVWAKADMVATVSFERLDLFRLARQPDGRRQYLRLLVQGEDLEAVRACVRLALGL
jgi:mRNA interferase MazF